MAAGRGAPRDGVLQPPWILGTSAPVGAKTEPLWLNIRWKTEVDAVARFSPELWVPLPSQPPAFPVFAICNQAGFLLSALFSFFFPSAGNDVDGAQEKFGGQQRQPRFPSEARQEQGQHLIRGASAITLCSWATAVKTCAGQSAIGAGMVQSPCPRAQIQLRRHFGGLGAENEGVQESSQAEGYRYTSIR